MSSNKLKVFAIITMVIDHVGYVLFPEILLLRIIGRLSFPIFTFLIAEGYFHSKNINKYMMRLGIFALISEVPFDLAFHGEFSEFQSQNIFFTLFLGLLSIRLYEHFKEKNKELAVTSVILMCLISFVLKTDYYVFGVLMIFAFNRLRDSMTRKLILSSILLMLLTWVIALSKGAYTMATLYQIFSLLALVLVYSYNGKPGMKLGVFKLALYIFYPLHLLVIFWLS